MLEKLVTVEGEMVFAKPPAAILDITGTASVREIKLLAGKAVVKGEVRVQCAWRAEGDSSLQSQAASLPFNQVVDLDGVAEDCKCMCVLEPVGFCADGRGTGSRRSADSQCDDASARMAFLPAAVRIGCVFHPV